MLLKNKVIEGIKSGKISLIFRRWKKAGVKKGGTQMTQLGVVGIDDVTQVSQEIHGLVRAERITEAVARLPRETTIAQL